MTDAQLAHRRSVSGLRPPELLFEFRRGRDGFAFKSPHLRELVFEVSMDKNTVLIITHTFQTRKGAVR